MITCAREGCDVQFEAKTHNQRYCSGECCRLATNARIMKNYYERRDQRLGKTRICNVCNETKLSRYNDSRVCGRCRAARNKERNRAVASMLSGVVTG